MIWYVLYKIPERHGLICKLATREGIDIDTKADTSIASEGRHNSHSVNTRAVQDFLYISKEDEQLVGSPSAEPSSPRMNEIRRQGSDRSLFTNRRISTNNSLRPSRLPSQFEAATENNSENFMYQRIPSQVALKKNHS